MTGPIAYSRGARTEDNTPAQRKAEDFDQFRDLVLSDQAATKGRQWIAAPFADAPDDEVHQQGGSGGSFRRAIGKPHRCMACALPRRFIGLDLDHVEDQDAFEDLQAWLRHERISAFGWTTHSHKPDGIRARFIVEVDRPMDRHECIRASASLRQRINVALGGEQARDRFGFDATLDRPEQPIYLPPKVGERFVLEGAPLSLDSLLADAPEIPQSDPAHAPMASFADGQVVDQDRHRYLLKRSLLLAAAVRSGALTRDDALLILKTERDGGKYSRHIPDDEIVRALDGAIAKVGPRALVDVEALLSKGAEPGLAQVPVHDLMGASLTPPRFVIDPLVPRRYVTLLGGHGGLGKSMLGLVLAAHVACGRGWGPVSVEQAPVVFVSLEDEASIVRYRLRRIIEAYELPPAEVLANLQLYDGTQVAAEIMVESDGTFGALMETPMMGEVERAVAGAGMVVVDNASDAFGGSENNRRQVRGFLRRLSQVAKVNDAGLILLAHIDKAAAKHGGSGNNYSGSTAWHNSVRSRLALVEAEGGGLELRQEKLNLGKKADPIVLQCVDHGVLVPGQLPQGGQSSATAIVAASDAEEVLQVLRVASEAGIDVPTATSGPAQAFHALASLPELPALFRTKAGRARLTAALVQLGRAGRIRRSEYRKPNRHPGERWELAQPGLGEAA